MGNMTGAEGQSLQLVQSANKYKCTSLWTVDMVRADSLSAYELCYQAYKDYTQNDRRLLHCYPAEVTAVNYEQRLSELRQHYRLLSPRIVYLLEYEERVKQFFRSCVYAFLEMASEERENKNFYLLYLPETRAGDVYYGMEEIELTPHVSGEPDFLTALETFVFKQADIRPELNVPINMDHLQVVLKEAEEEIGSGEFLEDQQDRTESAAEELSDPTTEEPEQNSENETEKYDRIIEYIQEFIQKDFPTRLQQSPDRAHSDLGALMELMLRDEITSLEVRKKSIESRKRREARQGLVRQDDGIGLRRRRRRR
jgi:hypothetical protein